MNQPLVLASRSPQRRAILEQLGVPFSVAVPETEELTAGPPRDVAEVNAYRKATAVAAQHPDGLVLGVDTIVSVGRQIYGKPATAAQAAATLRELSGRRHEVISGVCLMSGGAIQRVVAVTAVDFRVVEERLLEWYLASEEWRERAGGYAIQGRGAALVSSIQGDYLNVVGLPVTKLLELAPEILF